MSNAAQQATSFLLAEAAKHDPRPLIPTTLDALIELACLNEAGKDALKPHVDNANVSYIFGPAPPLVAAPEEREHLDEMEARQEFNKVTRDVLKPLEHAYTDLYSDLVAVDGKLAAPIPDDEVPTDANLPSLQRDLFALYAARTSLYIGAAGIIALIKRMADTDKSVAKLLDKLPLPPAIFPLESLHAGWRTVMDKVAPLPVCGTSITLIRKRFMALCTDAASRMRMFPIILPNFPAIGGNIITMWSENSPSMGSAAFGDHPPTGSAMENTPSRPHPSHTHMRFALANAARACVPNFKVHMVIIVRHPTANNEPIMIRELLDDPSGVPRTKTNSSVTLTPTGTHPEWEDEDIGSPAGLGPDTDPDHVRRPLMDLAITLALTPYRNAVQDALLATTVSKLDDITTLEQLHAELVGRMPGQPVHQQWLHALRNAPTHPPPDSPPPAGAVVDVAGLEAAVRVVEHRITALEKTVDDTVSHDELQAALRDHKQSIADLCVAKMNEAIAAAKPPPGGWQPAPQQAPAAAHNPYAAFATNAAGYGTLQQPAAPYGAAQAPPTQYPQFQYPAQPPYGAPAPGTSLAGATPTRTAKPGNEPTLKNHAHVHDFLHRTELFFGLTRIPHDEWITRALLNITSPDVVAAWSAFAATLPHAPTWDIFKQQLLIITGGHSFTQRALDSLSTCRQGDMSLDAYIKTYNRLVTQANENPNSPHIIRGFLRGISDSTFRALVATDPTRGHTQWTSLAALHGYAAQLYAEYKPVVRSKPDPLRGRVNHKPRTSFPRAPPTALHASNAGPKPKLASFTHNRRGGRAGGAGGSGGRGNGGYKRSRGGLDKNATRAYARKPENVDKFAGMEALRTMEGYNLTPEGLAEIAKKALEAKKAQGA